ncbi:unnamed protein product [Gongylonema pulchrum]|uniref:Uncharacterized protein n=1 Tax=Gongylonema pulchrum TaxID=637853 RepID=A0A183DEW6_9BILA|nr:unnamed protein product [Gongylonema pulchrum]
MTSSVAAGHLAGVGKRRTARLSMHARSIPSTSADLISNNSSAHSLISDPFMHTPLQAEPQFLE